MSIHRRDLVLRLIAAGGGPLFASLASQVPSAAHAQASSASWHAQFEASHAPWKPAFATAAADIPLTAARVRGRFPDAVAGTLYRVGPAGHDLGGERYQHWFDGDGMAHRFEIDGTTVHHQGRYVATAKGLAEVQAGRRLTEGFGTVFPGREPPSSPDSMNAANISMLPVGDDVLALWEGGSATRLDPRTLETRGLKTWRADLAGVPFSAHPRVEPDGTIWNFGVDAHHGSCCCCTRSPLQGRCGAPMRSRSATYPWCTTLRSRPGTSSSCCPRWCTTCSTAWPVRACWTRTNGAPSWACVCW